MLPTLSLPVYELTIPSSGKTARFRPFIVKEEKILLMAAESNDDAEIVNATKEILKNCCVDGDVDINTLPFFDVDYLFIALRAKSLGESIEMKFICNNVVEEQTCKNVFYADVDVSKVIVEKSDVQSKITLTENITVKMKYPTYAVMRMINEDDDIMERKIKVISACIDYIAEGDTVHSAKDYSKEELKAFIENLTEEQFNKLDEFIGNFPTFCVGVEATCKKCGFEHNIKYRDFASFF
jgi:hypothetical protein